MNEVGARKGGSSNCAFTIDMYFLPFLPAETLKGRPNLSELCQRSALNGQRVNDEPAARTGGCSRYLFTLASA